VLPARGCDARKCVKTSGFLDGLNIYQHQGGKVKQIYTPDTYVRLRHGGALDLSVCREDKIEILRSVLQSLALNHSAIELAMKLIAEIERAPRNGGVWGNVSRLVESRKCAACGLDTNLGGKGRLDLCKEHNNWRTYLKLRRGK
jgi:hypothetical protein